MCDKEGPTRARVSGSVAAIEPYDYFGNTDLCEAALIIAARRVTVSFAEAGSAAIEIVGRTEPEDRTLRVTRSVYVGG
jgi:hypothetical protein